MRIESSGSSDEELLAKTVFSFKKKEGASISNVTREPYVELQPVSPMANNKKCRPKHSFERLVADATSPKSVLADEAFWRGIKTVEIDDSEPNSDLGSGGVDQDLLRLEESLLEKDVGRAFLKNKTPSRSTQLDEAGVFELRGVVGDGKRPTMERFLHALVAAERGNFGYFFSFISNCLEMHIRALSMETLWYIWRPAHYLTNITGKSDVNSIQSILHMHAKVISMCSNCITKEDMNQQFSFLVDLLIDPWVYENYFCELSDLAVSIIEWLDVPRIHLLLDWIQSPCPINEHHSRFINISKLLSNSHLGLLGSNIILDSVLFAKVASFKGNEGDDFEFIYCANVILPSLSSLPAGYPTLTLMFYRLMRTNIEHDFKDSVTTLINHIKALRTAIPNSHFQLYISSRDILSKMETYLRTYLLKSKKGIIKVP